MFFYKEIGKRFLASLVIFLLLQTPLIGHAQALKLKILTKQSINSTNKGKYTIEMSSDHDLYTDNITWAIEGGIILSVDGNSGFNATYDGAITQGGQYIEVQWYSSTGCRLIARNNTNHNYEQAVAEVGNNVQVERVESKANLGNKFRINGPAGDDYQWEIFDNALGTWNTQITHNSNELEGVFFNSIIGNKIKVTDQKDNSILIDYDVPPISIFKDLTVYTNNRFQLGSVCQYRITPLFLTSTSTTPTLPSRYKWEIEGGDIINDNIAHEFGDNILVRWQDKNGGKLRASDINNINGFHSDWLTTNVEGIIATTIFLSNSATTAGNNKVEDFEDLCVYQLNGNRFSAPLGYGLGDDPPEYPNGVTTIDDSYRLDMGYSINWSVTNGTIISYYPLTVKWNKLPGKVTAAINYDINCSGWGCPTGGSSTYIETLEFEQVVNPLKANRIKYCKNLGGLDYPTYNLHNAIDCLEGNLEASWVNNGSSYDLTFQWQKSVNGIDFEDMAGETNISLNFSTSLERDYFFRRKVTDSKAAFSFSNVLYIKVHPQGWENLNYVREHTIQVSGKKTFEDVIYLPTSDKQQVTTYLDGLGRTIETVNKEMATPATGSTVWGDIVSGTEYDAFGRKLKAFLPFSTTTDLGYYKQDWQTLQAGYYNTANFNNETNPFAIAGYDNSPLNRVTEATASGKVWQASGVSGKKFDYDINNANDQVQQWSIDYTSNAIPNNKGAYPSNELFKKTYTDESGHQVIDFTNKAGQLVLHKTQVDPNPSDAHNGWICTYHVYDNYGRLRYQLQPEAVQYLEANNWSFFKADGTLNQEVLDGWCFWYVYDEKGNVVSKKAPGAQPLRMIYDIRNRLVFTQDGNQASAAVPQWMVNFYDVLDRPVLTALYNTSSSITQLQTDANNLTASTTTTTNQGSSIVNLVIDNRPSTNPIRYAATNSIDFVASTPAGFSTPTNDAFVAEIDPNATTPTIVQTVESLGKPVTNADLNNPSICTILKYYYYDNYHYGLSKTFNSNFKNTDAYASTTTSDDVPAIAASSRTIGSLTGTAVRVLGSNQFLTTTIFYDEEGKAIQSNEDNIKGGTDVHTTQYHWNGTVLSSYSDHTSTGTGYSNGFGMLHKNEYDSRWRIEAKTVTYGSNSPKKIVSYAYDDLGKLKTKTLDPDFKGAGNPLEALEYSYNLHNQITGINKEYALKNNSKNEHYFGMCLGFENKESNTFNQSSLLLNGQVAGIVWCTQGDYTQRKYEYSYDPAGRLISAQFNEKDAAGTWGNSMLDFSVWGKSGNGISYDLNGNIQNMVQKGWKLVQGTVEIDNLDYSYKPFSNQLLSVTDNGTSGAADGQNGDFKDGNTGDDYVYDDNGNLVIDLNKNIKNLGGATSTNGIRYNFLDKPEEINIAGKGVVKIVYDADGNKLQKTFTPVKGSVKTTTYINEFVYSDNQLQYINFEEGRLRVLQPYSFSVTDANGTVLDNTNVSGNLSLPVNAATFDYYIRDYQQNVRMILTEETYQKLNTCSMETDNGRGKKEADEFSSVNGNEVNNTRVPVASMLNQPWSGSIAQINKHGNYAGKLEKNNSIGASKLLHVMAGDNITTTVDYYYPQTNFTRNGSTSPVSNMVLNLYNILLDGTVGASALKNASNVKAQILSSGSIGSPLDNFLDPHKGTTSSSTPEAYLQVLFFDERFIFDQYNSRSIQVSDPNDENGFLPLSNVVAPKNGYVFIYISNNSIEPVYFDNLKVNYTRGNILEENHYYAYGLKIAPLSSNVLPDLEEGETGNKRLYNDKELWEEGDLNWYDYGFRNYDAQIGRFTQLDPLTWEYPELTNYQYASCEPIANVDRDGLEADPCIVYQPLDFWNKNPFFSDNSFSEVIVKGTIKASSIAQTGQLAVSNLAILQANFLQPAFLFTTAFAVSAINAFVTDHTFGIGRLPDANTNSDAINFGDELGKKTGDALALILGSSEALLGTGVTIGTGGAAALVGSPLLAVYGASVAGVATYHLATDGSIVYSTSTNSNESDSYESSSNASKGSSSGSGDKVEDAVGGVIINVENSPYLTVQKGNRTFHISPKRVKEFVKNPLNPNSRLGDQVDFKKYGVPKGSEIIKGTGKGHKRTPTPGEIEMYNNYFKK